LSGDFNGQSFIEENTKEKKTDNELQSTTQKIKEQHEPTTVCADNSRHHGDHYCLNLVLLMAKRIDFYFKLNQK
jgi:hypothetical protein